MFGTTQQPEYFKSEEVLTLIRNLRLDGFKRLCADKVTSTYEVHRHVHPRTKKPTSIAFKTLKHEETEIISYYLMEIPAEKLNYFREEKIPSFVLKANDKYYHCEIPANLSFVSANILGCHQCATSVSSCDRLLARSDEDGGCNKVRDRFKRIENYPWITHGYETFNTDHDSFVVTSCLHFVPESNRTHF